MKDVRFSVYCIVQTGCRNVVTMLSCLQAANDRAPGLVKPAKDGAHDPQESPQGKTILIVEDSQFERTVIPAAVDCLTNFNVCVEASEGVEAIQNVKELRPDLIIIYLAMPLMNGVEAATRPKHTIA